MSVQSFFNNLVHQMFHNCLLSIFFRHKSKIYVRYQNHDNYHQQHLQIRVDHAFHRNVLPMQHQPNHVQPLPQYRPIPQPIYQRPYDHNPVYQDIAFDPYKNLQPIALQVQPHNMHAELIRQSNQLQNEIEQLFTELAGRGYFMARQPSPVVLGNQNAEKQQELSAKRQQLHHVLQFANHEMLDLVGNTTDARELLKRRFAKICVLLANEGHEKNVELQNQYNDLAGLEAALERLEKKFQRFLGSSVQPNAPQNPEEAQIAILLSNMERFNRQKTILLNCQKGGFSNAFELQQLLSGLEAEYQELDEKCEKIKIDIIQAENHVADLTNHLLDISNAVDHFVAKYPLEKKPFLNLPHEKIAQMAVFHEVKPQQNKKAEVIEPMNAKLNEAVLKAQNALRALVAVARAKEIEE